MSLSLPSPIKGIIFDLDGTLYHMKWFMKPLLTFRLFPHILYLPRYMAIRKKFSGKDMQNGEALIHAMAEKLADKVNAADTATMVSWIQDAFYRAFVDIMPLLKGSRPAINAVLSDLKQKGYRLGILSDFARIEERLQGLQIDCTFFDTLVSSESAGSLKPGIRPLLAIQESWQIQPSHILIVGDRDDTDGIAASEAGMHYLKISDKKMKTPNACSWPQLKEALQTLPAI